MKLKKFLKKRKNSTFDLLKERLEQRGKELTLEFEEKNSEVDKWLKRRGIKLSEVWSKGSRGLVAGAAAGAVLLSSGVSQASTSEKPPVVKELDSNKIVSDIIAREEVDQKLASLLKEKLGDKKQISSEDQKQITQIISDTVGVRVSSELDGNRLNTNLGLIGLEQHLPRYPGETMSEHFGSFAGSSAYGKTGMTFGRGAFGYFATDRFHLTSDAIEREKYYVVVQTFLSHGWGKKPGIADWYKYRKVLVVNPENGRVVVGDIADSGPAVSTGKSFGGSPELMDQLGLYRTQTKGKVLIFFIDNNYSNPKLGPL